MRDAGGEGGKEGGRGLTHTHTHTHTHTLKQGGTGWLDSISRNRWRRLTYTEALDGWILGSSPHGKISIGFCFVFFLSFSRRYITGLSCKQPATENNLKSNQTTKKKNAIKIPRQEELQNGAQRWRQASTIRKKRKKTQQPKKKKRPRRRKRRRRRRRRRG